MFAMNKSISPQHKNDSVQQFEIKTTSEIHEQIKSREACGPHLMDLDREKRMQIDCCWPVDEEIQEIGKVEDGDGRRPLVPSFPGRGLVVASSATGWARRRLTALLALLGQAPGAGVIAMSEPCGRGWSGPCCPRPC
jgi:hypothetical protein